MEGSFSIINLFYNNISLSGLNTESCSLETSTELTYAPACKDLGEQIFL